MYRRAVVGLGDDQQLRRAQRAADIGGDDAGIPRRRKAATQQTEGGARQRDQRGSIAPPAQAALTKADEGKVVRFHVLQQRPALGDHIRGQRRRAPADVGAELEHRVAHAHPVAAGPSYIRECRQQAPPQPFAFGLVADAIDAPILPGFAHPALGAIRGLDLGMQRLDGSGSLAPHAQDRMDDQLHR